MELALVRHACAGRKRDWSGPDLLRPLDDVGVEQAAAIAAFFDGRAVTRLLSSPALRCAQTLQPLADGREISVHPSRQLRPDATPRQVLALLTAPDNDKAVVCTHGETMANLLPGLARLGATPGPGSRDRILQKASIWMLRVEPGPRPRIVTIDHHLPAGIRRCLPDAFADRR